jgi:hypothetical protein
MDSKCWKCTSEINYAMHLIDYCVSAGFGKNGRLADGTHEALRYKWSGLLGSTPWTLQPTWR